MGTTTALAWMFVSIGVASGDGVGAVTGGVGRTVVSGVATTGSLRDGVVVGVGDGPVSRPP
jgi:hypothetical protein